MFKRQMEKMQYWRAKWTYSNRYQELLRWYSLFDTDGKESACSAGDLGMIPGSGRPPGEGNGYPLQYSCLENSMERGAWWATVHRVAKSWTRLSYWATYTHTHTHTHPQTHKEICRNRGRSSSEITLSSISSVCTVCILIYIMDKRSM